MADGHHDRKSGGGARDHGLDAARCFLMLLGVPYHAALIYTPDYRWLIDSATENAALGLFADFIHTFRMPAFFLISGMLTAKSLRSGGPRAVLASRAVRLLVPLVAVAVSLNVFQLWVSTLAADPGLSAKEFLTDVLPPAVARGELVMHLWFLIELFACVLLVCAAHALGGGFGWLARLPINKWAIPALLCVLMIGVLGLDNLSPWLVEKVPPTTTSAATLAVSFSYFAVGVLIAQAPGGTRRFASTRWTVALAFVLGFLIHQALAIIDKPMALRLFDQALGAILAWTAFRLVLGMAQAWFSGASAVVRALSQASYTVYLLHHAVVVGVGFLFLALPWRPAVEFAAVTALGLAIPFLIHHAAVEKSPVLRFLLNGVPLRAARVRVQPATS